MPKKVLKKKGVRKFGDNLKGLFLKELNESVKTDCVDVRVRGRVQKISELDPEDRELQSEGNFAFLLHEEFGECKVPELGGIELEQRAVFK
jgi:hypothetical protein